MHRLPLLSPLPTVGMTEIPKVALDHGLKETTAYFKRTLERDEHRASRVADYAFRHHVKPGITGWAQINGYRGGTVQVGLMQKRLDFDLWYINNWNLGLDLLILFRTVLELMRPRNAY
jgi:lipopolysaccharide/colanic/teichoic acid biosynthesis glycosyltransferase